MENGHGSQGTETEEGEEARIQQGERIKEEMRIEEDERTDEGKGPQNPSDVVVSSTENDEHLLRDVSFIDLRYRYNMTSDAISLSTGQGTNSTYSGSAGEVAEMSTANAISPEEWTLSSLAIYSTTEVFTRHHSGDWITIPSRWYRQRNAAKLRLFDKEIPQITLHRFRDLQELFARPLWDYLIQAKINPGLIAFRLKIVGESEATATPRIVVMCVSTAYKMVRRFFNQQHIRREYQPSDTDSFRPSFKILVVAWPSYILELNEYVLQRRRNIFGKWKDPQSPRSPSVLLLDFGLYGVFIDSSY